MNAHFEDFEEYHAQQTFIEQLHRIQSEAKCSHVIYIQYWNQDPADWAMFPIWWPFTHSHLLAIHSALNLQRSSTGLPCPGHTGLLSHENFTIIARWPKLIMRRNPFIQGLGINLMEPEQRKQGKRAKSIHC